MATSATTVATLSSAIGAMVMPGTSAIGPVRIRSRFCRANSNHCVERTIVSRGLTSLAICSWMVLPAKYPYPCTAGSVQLTIDRSTWCAWRSVAAAAIARVEWPKKSVARRRLVVNMPVASTMTSAPASRFVAS